MLNRLNEDPKFELKSRKGIICPLTSIEPILKSRIYALPHVLLGNPKLDPLLFKGFIFPFVNNSPLIISISEFIDNILSIVLFIP